MTTKPTMKARIVRKDNGPGNPATAVLREFTDRSSAERYYANSLSRPRRTTVSGTRKLNVYHLQVAFQFADGSVEWRDEYWDNQGILAVHAQRMTE